jgi:hypothetical protein
VNPPETRLNPGHRRRDHHPNPVTGTRKRLTVDYLYSLYDALVSINVPNDKARAVVDAMERDMGTTIATKADLQMLRQEVAGLASREELLAVKAELKADITEVRQAVALLRKDMEVMAATLSMNLTVRMGSMLVVSLGLLFAALKLT